MDSKWKVSHIFNNNNSQGSQQRGWQKTDCETVYKLILKVAKLKTGKKCKKTKLTAGWIPLMRQRSSLDCSAI
jgi:hypothetical protein